jgi:hypothetical protein
VTNGTRVDPHSSAYESVCGHIARGVCGPRWNAWHMAPALDVRLCAKGDVPKYGLVCGHMARVGSDGTHNMAYSAGTGCMVVKLDRRGRRVL